MSKPDQRETAVPAVGTPLDCGVGRLAPERAEVGWLIEQDNHFPRHRWLRLVVESYNGVPRARIDWTEHADLALRFARREDARAFAALHHEHCTLALLTEHWWMPHEPPNVRIEPHLPAQED